MAGPDDYYQDGESEDFSEQCNGCEAYVEADAENGLCPDCLELRGD